MQADQLFGSYLYENLSFVSSFNENTGLYLFEPSHRLYTVKKTDISCRACCEKLMTLNEAHLAKIVYVADQGDHLAVVQEFISGETVAEKLKRGPLPLQEALKIAADVCEGLAAIHAIGCVHRDVTPNNIVLSGGSAVIIDYGIARMVMPDKGSDTNILGTPGYAAPEQFGFTQSDARTDIYALGILLNVMLSGKLPNEEAVGGAVGKIIKKCIAIDSRKRYGSILRVRDALIKLMVTRTPLDRGIDLIPGLRSRPPAVIVLAVILYLAAALFSVAYFSVSFDMHKFFPYFIGWLLLLAIPFCCFHNFLNIYERLPFLRGASRLRQRVFYTIIGIVSILTGLIVVGLA